jgi:ABC-type antimicrobial peptide transport system permease subunit
LVRALDRALSAYPGFEYQQVVSIDPGLAAHGYSAVQARNYLDSLLNRLRDLPGIESVSMTASPPLGNKKVVTGAEIQGRSLDVYMYAVDPEFFGTMKIPLLRGRSLAAGDTHSIVISNSFARQWPTGDPLGKPFQMGDARYTIVGISGSARLVAIQDPDAVEAYYIAGDVDLPSMVVLVKSSGPPEGLVSFLASVAKSIDPDVLPDVQLLRSSFCRKTEASKSAVVAVSLLGAVALLLACLGVVGLVCYAVSQRTKEIGIRMALGAKPAHVMSIVIRQLRQPILGGLVVGLGGAAALSQILRRQLYGISSLDPTAYLAAIGIFAFMVFWAALLPAKRALRADPSRSLRYE